MYRIAATRSLTEFVYSIDIEAPRIASAAAPGQHVDVHVNVDGAVLTLPIASIDAAAGTITVVHRAQDLPSQQLALFGSGDELFRVRGPLGGACATLDGGKVVLAGEDLGVASLRVRAAALKNRGVYTIGILGFESRDDIYWESEMAAVCDELYVCTRDGSYGVHGRISNPVRAVCETHRDVERIVMIGTLRKMRRVAKIAADFGVPAFVSFDALRPAAGEPGVFDIADSTQSAFEFARAPEIAAADVDFDKLVARERAIAKAAEGDETDGAVVSQAIDAGDSAPDGKTIGPVPGDDTAGPSPATAPSA